MKAPRFYLKKRPQPEMALQITSMADIFMILLVFLLKSHATGATNISPSAGLELPSARSDLDQVQAMKIEISEKAVQIDDKPITRLAGFRFDPQDVEEGIGRVPSLISAIKLVRARQDLIAQSNPEVKSDNRVLVVADQRAPYVTIKRVVLAAALHGYSDLKLVVVKKE